MKQNSFFKLYVRPEVRYVLPDSLIKSTYKKSPSLGTVCKYLCVFQTNCPRLFSSCCSKADLRSNYKVTHYF